MNKELRNATTRELESWPGVTMTEDEGGKHGKLTLHYKGESRLVVVSNTPSDSRALPNHIALVRREIRALGAERAHIASGPKMQGSVANPVMRADHICKEKTMTREAKQESIFKSIGDLRYSEMLALAEFLRDVATESNLQRGNPQSWAKMLQMAVDCQLSVKGEAA